MSAEETGRLYQSAASGLPHFVVEPWQPPWQAWPAGFASRPICNRKVGVQAFRPPMTPQSARTRELLRPVAPIPRALGAWAGPVLIYGVLGLVAVGAALARGQSPIGAEAWLPLSGTLGHVASLAGGLVLAAVTIRATRHFVRHWGWADRKSVV